MTYTLTHVAIICDGNRRWATKRGLPKMIGHTEGAKNIKRITEAALHEKIKYLTLYVLSTENLKNRSESELKHLFTLFGRILEYLGEFTKNNVRLNIIGDIAGLPEKTQKNLYETMERTKHNTGMVLTLAANYGGRDEITRAIKKIIASQAKQEDIDEAYVQSMLDTEHIPEVDLMIRTSGHQRTSNYLPWQLAYAELYFTQVKWPAFSPENLREAIDWYSQQKRNRGK